MRTELGPHRQSAGAVFEAAAASSGRTFGVATLAGSLVGLGAIVTTSALCPRWVAGVVIAVCLTAWIVVMASLFRTRPVHLEVETGLLRVAGAMSGEFPLASAGFGAWSNAHLGVSAGTVLHLASGERTFTLAGQDHKPPATLALTRAPVGSVDAYMPAERFDELLSRAGLGQGSAYRSPAQQAAVPVSIELAPNPNAASSTLKMIAPWLVTIVVASVVGPTVGIAMNGSPATTTVMPIALGVVIVTGLVITVVLSMRRRHPVRHLTIADGALHVRDARTGEELGSAPLAALSPTPAVHVVRSRGTVSYPALVLRVPRLGDVSLCVWDPRFLWPGAREVGCPAYVVGAPDWIALTQALGLRA